MDDLKIEYVPIDSIRPYANNAKEHPAEQVEQIKASMQEFGNLDPIGVWHGEVVEGHGRLMAARELGMQTVPVIRLDALTDDQRKAYALVHNQLTMNSGWDEQILRMELEDIDLDLEPFGLELPDDDPDEDDGYYGDAREKTYKAVNLGEFDETRAAGFYQMPTIRPCNFIPDDLIGFNYVKTAAEYSAGVHFFIDDYQFERMWNSPHEMIDRLKPFQCCLTPDWSLYMDMPMAMKVWNVYRSRLVGQMMQDAGIKVIPTLSWAQPETFTFCFDGLGQGGTVAVSTVGVMRDKSAQEVWKAGMDEAMKRLKPKTVLCYGTKIDYNFKCDVKYYEARKFGG